MFWLLCWICPLVFILLTLAFVRLADRDAAAKLPRGIEVNIGKLKKSDIIRLDDSQNARLRRAVGERFGLAVVLNWIISAMFTAAYGMFSAWGLGGILVCVLLCNLLDLGAGLAAVLSVMKPANVLWRELNEDIQTN